MSLLDQTIKLSIKGIEIEVTLAEAKRLHAELGLIFVPVHTSGFHNVKPGTFVPYPGGKTATEILESIETWSEHFPH